MTGAYLSFPDWVDKLLNDLEKDGRIRTKGGYFQEATRKGLMSQLKKDFPEEYAKYSKE